MVIYMKNGEKIVLKDNEVKEVAFFVQPGPREVPVVISRSRVPGILELRILGDNNYRPCVIPISDKVIEVYAW